MIDVEEFSFIRQHLNNDKRKTNVRSTKKRPRKTGLSSDSTEYNNKSKNRTTIN